MGRGPQGGRWAISDREVEGSGVFEGRGVPGMGGRGRLGLFFGDYWGEMRASIGEMNGWWGKNGLRMGMGGRGEIVDTGEAGGGISVG
ncbi:hypothetical protein Tco_0991703 [Tanacetum coccineum]|uniref:Uncharacterized protein n=1 Tax=Tanacetum coccineum TaxID=301880 RepID=A0ABQ5F0S3_9ASTR